MRFCPVAVTTDCARLFAYRDDDQVWVAPVLFGAEQAETTFAHFATFKDSLFVFAMSSDAAFLYAGNANGLGLYRIHTTEKRG